VMRQGTCIAQNSNCSCYACALCWHEEQDCVTYLWYSSLVSRISTNCCLSSICTVEALYPTSISQSDTASKSALLVAIAICNTKLCHYMLTLEPPIKKSRAPPKTVNFPCTCISGSTPDRLKIITSDSVPCPVQEPSGNL